MRHTVAGEELPWVEVEKLTQKYLERLDGVEDLEYELKQYPANFTVWFRICFQEVKDKLTTLQYA